MPITWNPEDKAPNILLSNGDLTLVNTAGDNVFEGARTTHSTSTDKIYFEVTLDDLACDIGIALINADLFHHAGWDNQGWGILTGVANGMKIHNNVPEAYFGYHILDPGTVIGTALDLIAGKVWWSDDGVYAAGGDPAAGTGEAYSGLSGAFFALAVVFWNSGGQITANFGATPFATNPPNGFIAFDDSLITYALTGTLTEKGSPVIRTINSYIRSTGELYSSTVSEANGTFSLAAPDTTTEMYILALDNDPGDQYNALIYDRVKGVVD